MLQEISAKNDREPEQELLSVGVEDERIGHSVDSPSIAWVDAVNRESEKTKGKHTHTNNRRKQKVSLHQHWLECETGETRNR